MRTLDVSNNSNAKKLLSRPLISNASKRVGGGDSLRMMRVSKAVHRTLQAELNDNIAFEDFGSSNVHKRPPKINQRPKRERTRNEGAKLSGWEYDLEDDGGDEQNERQKRREVPEQQVGNDDRRRQRRNRNRRVVQPTPPPDEDAVAWATDEISGVRVEVLEVRMTRDLREAFVTWRPDFFGVAQYLESFDDDGDEERDERLSAVTDRHRAILENESGRLRSAVSNRLKLRFSPQLHFSLGESEELDLDFSAPPESVKSMADYLKYEEEMARRTNAKYARHLFNDEGERVDDDDRRNDDEKRNHRRRRA